MNIITRKISNSNELLYSQIPTCSTNDYVSLAISNLNNGILKDTGFWVEETVHVLPSSPNPFETKGTGFHCTTWAQGTLTLFYKDSNEQTYVLASDMAKEFYEKTENIKIVIDAFKLGQSL